jgi:hypothetical protein
MPMISSDTIWARSTFFKPEDGEDQEANPGVYGRTFARWTSERLREAGIEVDEVFGEDWGWCIMLTRRPCRIFVACGHRFGQVDEWGASVVAEPGILQRFRRKADAAPYVQRVYELLLDIMRRSPECGEVHTEAHTPRLAT